MFQTTDGYINVACSGEQMWQRLCDVLSANDLRDHPDYADGEARLQNRDALNGKLGDCFSNKSSSEWICALNEAGVPCGPIYHMDEMWSDPQVEHLEMSRPVDHSVLGKYDVVRNATNLSGALKMAYRAAPERGQHTDEVLREFGFSDDEIEPLRKQKIV